MQSTTTTIKTTKVSIKQRKKTNEKKLIKENTKKQSYGEEKDDV